MTNYKKNDSQHHFQEITMDKQQVYDHRGNKGSVFYNCC